MKAGGKASNPITLCRYVVVSLCLVLASGVPKYSPHDVWVQHEVGSDGLHTFSTKPLRSKRTATEWADLKAWLNKHLEGHDCLSVEDFTTSKGEQDGDLGDCDQGIQEARDAKNEGSFKMGKNWLDDVATKGAYCVANINSEEYWEIVKKAQLPELYDIIKYENEWMALFPSDDIRHSFQNTLTWNFVLAGTKDTGMGLHKDAFPMNSYQIILKGSKAYLLCDMKYAEDGHGESSKCGMMKSRSWKRKNRDTPHQLRRKDSSYYEPCSMAFLSEGETLYYTKYYFHETTNMDTLTVAISGNVVAKNNYKDVIDYLERMCPKLPIWRDAKPFSALEEFEAGSGRMVPVEGRTDAQEYPYLHNARVKKYSTSRRKLSEEVCEALPKIFAHWEDKWGTFSRGNSRIDGATDISHLGKPVRYLKKGDIVRYKDKVGRIEKDVMRFDKFVKIKYSNGRTLELGIGLAKELEQTTETYTSVHPTDHQTHDEGPFHEQEYEEFEDAPAPKAGDRLEYKGMKGSIQHDLDDQSEHAHVRFDDGTVIQVGLHEDINWLIDDEGKALRAKEEL